MIFFAWKNNFKHVLVFKEAGSSTNFPSDLPAIFSHLVNKNSILNSWNINLNIFLYYHIELFISRRLIMYKKWPRSSSSLYEGFHKYIYSLKFLYTFKILAKITVTRTYRTKLNTNRMNTRVHVNVVAIILFQ